MAKDFLRFLSPLLHGTQLSLIQHSGQSVSHTRLFFPAFNFLLTYFLHLHHWVNYLTTGLSVPNIKTAGRRLINWLKSFDISNTRETPIVIHMQGKNSVNLSPYPQHYWSVVSDVTVSSSLSLFIIILIFFLFYFFIMPLKIKSKTW